METIKFRGKVINDTEAQSYWMFVTPDSFSWEQFWTITRKKTRGQFTGLTDHSGKEIYEGDIVTCEGFGGIYKVEYEGCSFIGRHLQNSQWVDLEMQELEVIGNIYEPLEIEPQ